MDYSRPDRDGPNPMKTILILAANALCVFNVKADDDYATIVRFLGEHGHILISPDDVAEVQAFMKANGYQHVSEIPKSAATAFDAVQGATSAPTQASTPTEDFPPVAVHVGDTVADALAYSKQLIPFLRTHVLLGE
jgi:hypothetical protein